MLLKFLPLDSLNWIKFYDSTVSQTIDDSYQNIVQIFEEDAKSTPNKIACSFHGKNLRYKHLAHKSNKFAASLVCLGVKKGDRICFMIPNIISFPIIHLAILKIGAISVPINPLFTKYEIENLLKLSGAKILITIDKFYNKVKDVRQTTNVEKVIICCLTDFCSLLVKIGYRFRYGKERIDFKGNGFCSFTSLIRNSNPKMKFPDINLEDVAILLTTGGKSGTLKLAAITHGNLISNVKQVLSWNLNFAKNGDSMLGALPLFHSFGITLCLHYCLIGGVRLILLSKFSAKKVLKTIKKYKVNYFPGVPTMFACFLGLNIKKKIFKSLNFCISGGSKLNAELQRQFEEITGVKIIESYGLTEASPAVMANPLNGTRKIDSIGIPLPSTHAKVVNPYNGKELACGEEGELIIKGPQVMKEYWNDPEETRKTIRNGWLYTGDKAKIDKDNYFYITGRFKDLIIYCGYNVFPSEVESILAKHPQVKNSSVCGINDKKCGELVKAYIIPINNGQINIREIKEFCKRYLVWYKIPKKIDVVYELPEKQYN